MGKGSSLSLPGKGDTWTCQASCSFPALHEAGGHWGQTQYPCPSVPSTRQAKELLRGPECFAQC